MRPTFHSLRPPSCANSDAPDQTTTVNEAIRPEDLAMLNKIKVTDYTYIDVSVAMGNGVHKSAIAQELEQVYPQAVNKTTNYYPGYLCPGDQCRSTE